jgi:outer membrane protein assembly factor BamB
MRKTSFAGLLTGLLGGMVSCGHPAGPDGASWKRHYPAIGVYSSPRVADLNGDGTGDIIAGAGSAEWEKSDSAIIALDGRSGKLLWRVAARNQMVGSAVLYDISGDGVPDVLLGGRSAELRAIDGADGKTLWEFYPTDQTHGHRAGGWYNFSTPQLIGDQDGDGYRDLLVANGGDASVAPGDPKRPAGCLMVVSSKDGGVIARATVPDGRETYLSPVIANLGPLTDSPAIFFGTGGETMPGHLYRTTLRALLDNDISGAVPLAASESGKGFIASPVLADVTGDGVPDIIANAVEGRMMAFDGKTNGKIWENRFWDSECYVSPTPGYFNDDDTPDFFMMHAVGVWPQFQQVVEVAVLDGKTGGFIGRRQYLNCSFTFAAPLTVDVDGDGFTEVVMGCNNRSTAVLDKPADQFSFKLLFWDIRRGNKQYLGDSLQGVNWASTPWLGDLDRDGRTDLVCFAEATNRDYNPEEASYSFPLGTNVMRKVVLDFPPERVYWGSYLGSDHNSVFTRKKGGTSDHTRDTRPVHYASPASPH